MKARLHSDVEEIVQLVRAAPDWPPLGYLILVTYQSSTTGSHLLDIPMYMQWSSSLSVCCNTMKALTILSRTKWSIVAITTLSRECFCVQLGWIQRMKSLSLIICHIVIYWLISINPLPAILPVWKLALKLPDPHHSRNFCGLILPLTPPPTTHESLFLPGICLGHPIRMRDLLLNPRVRGSASVEVLSWSRYKPSLVCEATRLTLMCAYSYSQAFKRIYLSPSEANDKPYESERVVIDQVTCGSISWVAVLVIQSFLRFLRLSLKYPLFCHRFDIRCRPIPDSGPSERTLRHSTIENSTTTLWRFLGTHRIKIVCLTFLSGGTGTALTFTFPYTVADNNNKIVVVLSFLKPPKRKTTKSPTNQQWIFLLSGRITEAGIA